MITPLEEHKLLTVLEFYLSLHEAIEVYDAIFNDKVTDSEIEDMLKKYRELSEKE